MLQEEIKKLVEEKIAGSDCFFVDVKISPSKIMVYIDTPSGVRIEDCVAVSKYIHEKTEGSDVMEFHELEVSSPGMDQPLKVLPQYQKRIGSELSVLSFDGIKHNGILKAVTNDEIELEESFSKKVNGKKEKTTQLNHFLFTQIKEAKIVFSFEKTLN